MKGSFIKFKWRWPSCIEHNHSDPEKSLRYQIGSERLHFLKNFSQNFAYEENENGDSILAYLVELDSEDLDNRMPQTTKYEYICGKISENSFLLFSYLWFESLDDAKVYVQRKNMTILGGWNEE